MSRDAFSHRQCMSRSSHLYASLRPLREQAQRRSRCIGGFVPGNPGKTLLHRRWSCHIRPVSCGPERFAESSPGDRPTASRPWRSNVVIWRSRSASASALVLKNFRPRLKGRRSRYQGCVWLWRHWRTLSVGRLMTAISRSENVNTRSTKIFAAH